MNDKNNIINIFKKSISSTVRAISENSDLEISYGSISKKKTENKIILPIPSLKFPESEKNEIRGKADIIALKIRYHDDKLHKIKSPKSPNGKKIFDSIENARFQSIGIKKFPGISKNISNSIESKYELKNIDSKKDVAIEDAIQLIIQEYFTEKICN